MISENKKRKNNYLHFAWKFVLLLFIVFLLDFAIGKTLRYYYFKQDVGRLFRATYAIEKTTADVLVFGSSRAYHHYIPDTIENKLKQTCYNTGSPGQFLLYNYATLKAILKRYSPKMIILDLSTGEFKVDKESYDRLSFLLPYYKDHKEIRPIVDLKSPLEKYKLLSSIYPFNSSFLMIAGGNSAYFKKRNTDIKGYKPLTNVWKNSIEVRDSEMYDVDTVKVNIYKSFIDDCQRSGVKLFVVCSPTYIHYNQPEHSISMIEAIAKDKNVQFIDFTNDSMFNDHASLFDDPAHLNVEGAGIFTRKVIDSISNILKVR